MSGMQYTIWVLKLETPTGFHSEALHFTMFNFHEFFFMSVLMRLKQVGPCKRIMPEVVGVESR